MIQIAIVEDNISYRKSLLKIIQLAEDMNCLSSYPSGELFLKDLNNNSTGDIKVLLLDLNLPGENGLQLIPQIKSITPEIEIIILTQNSDYRIALEALHLDASGYLIKGAPIDKIREVIRCIARGETHIDAQLSKIVLQSLCGHDMIENNPLTTREIEILKLLSIGLAQKKSLRN